MARPEAPPTALLSRGPAPSSAAAARGPSPPAAPSPVPSSLGPASRRHPARPDPTALPSGSQRRRPRESGREVGEAPGDAWRGGTLGQRAPAPRRPRPGRGRAGGSGPGPGPARRGAPLAKPTAPPRGASGAGLQAVGGPGRGGGRRGERGGASARPALELRGRSGLSAPGSGCRGPPSCCGVYLLQVWLVPQSLGSAAA